MYYPPSQIKTNLYTNGNELVYSSDYSDYQGYYYKTSNGKYYTGKTPNDKPNNLLREKTESNPGNDAELYEAGTFTQTTSVYNFPTAYAINNKLKIGSIPPLAPLQVNPEPTSNQYKIGEFQRYFTKKLNSESYKEIDKNQYDKFSKNDETVDYKLYSAFQIPWVISGNRDNAYNVNEKTVDRVSNNLNLYGFKSYFKGQFSQYFGYKENENLYTGGGEYRIRGSIKDYVGYYHIHPDKGAMVGSQHTTKPHEYLDSIKNTVKKKIGKRSGGY
jgi:hypothetical protein